MSEKLLFELVLHSGFDYPALVGELVGRYASNAVKLSPAEVALVTAATEESYQFLLQHGIWYYEKPEIKCQLHFNSAGLTVQFLDKASPWKEHLLRQNLVQFFQTDLSSNTTLEAFNLGLKGRKLRLTIPIEGGTQVNSQIENQLPTPKKTDITYRLLMPSEAHEMVNCLYTAYGYTYGVPDVYSHDETSELMEKGQIVILGAEAEDGEIAGVSTLRKRSAASNIYDLCQTAVKPDYKGNRIFENLLQGVITSAELDFDAQGLSATIPNRHLISQDRMETAGFVPVGIFLGMVEAAFLPAQIGPFAQERESFLSVYKPFQEPGFGPLFVPEHHLAMIAHLCEETGVESTIQPIEPNLASFGTTQLQTAEVENMKAGFIEIESAGADIVDVVFDRLSEFNQRHFSTIHLYLDLSDPNAMACCERLEAMGFFFASFFPDEKPWLILQYLNNVPVLFDELLYPFPGAKRIQYHIERVYRLVQLRQKGEAVSASQSLPLPEMPKLPQPQTQRPETNNRISG